MKTVSLMEIATIHDKKRVPLNSRQRAKRQGSIPYYGATGIIDYVDEPLFDGEYVLIGEDGENLRSKKSDLAFKVSGRFWVNNHAHIVQGKEPWLNDYIVSVFRALDISPYITGAAQPKLNQAALMKIPIYWPGEEKAKEIADILEAIDRKIELNRRMNKTLEQMGLALFRHYFIANSQDEYAALSDFVQHVKISVSPALSPDVTFCQYSIPAYDNSLTPELTIGMDIKSNKYRVVSNSILVSKLNPATPRIWIVFDPKDEAVCSTEFLVLQPKRHLAFTYFTLMSREFSDKMALSASGTSNSHKRVRPTDILKYSFIKPDDDAIQKFEKVALQLLKLTDDNRKEIQTLTALRDTLLPRLISGRWKMSKPLYN
jgi:type I restriction enzyme S subunit